MGGHSQLLPWERYEVWVCHIEGSSSFQTPNGHDCSCTILDNIWRAYADSWYRQWTRANAGSEFSTRKYSNEGGFRETTVTQIHTASFVWRGTQFNTNAGCKVCWTCKLLLLHKASLVHYHIEIRYGRRYGDGSRVARGIDSQIVDLDDLSVVTAVCVPTLLRVSCFSISLTKLWDMIFHQCVCKGRTGHAKVLDSKSHW